MAKKKEMKKGIERKILDARNFLLPTFKKNYLQFFLFSYMKKSG